MGRKSSVSRLEPAARKHLEKLLREDRLTLDQLLAEMRAKFPTADVSRSGIHRYQQSFEEMVGRMLEVEPQTRFPTYGSLLGDIAMN